MRIYLWTSVDLLNPDSSFVGRSLGYLLDIPSFFHHFFASGAFWGSNPRRIFFVFCGFLYVYVLPYSHQLNISFLFYFILFCLLHHRALEVPSSNISFLFKLCVRRCGSWDLIKDCKKKNTSCCFSYMYIITG